jgi:putative tricarboxylic transport membrane protein
MRLMGEKRQIRVDGAAQAQAQRAAALAFALLCLGFVWQARSYPYLDDTGPGAGFFALWIGGLGLLVGVAMLVWPQSPSGEAEAAEPPLPGAGRTILLTLAALAAAGLALEPLGFRPTAFLLLALLLRSYGARWRSALLFAALISVLIFHLFEALRLRLPVGAFGV